jgi:hypothetical protein
MPPAKPRSPPLPPALLSDDEISFIKDTVKRFYGADAVVRNFGPDPARLALHIETDRDIGMMKYDCFGVLLAGIDRDHINIEVTKRGTRPRGQAKIAYRQGIIL